MVQKTGKRNRLLKFTSIRSRLLSVFLSMALLIAVGVSIGSIILGVINGQKQSVDRVNSTADLKEFYISNWVNEQQTELIFFMNESYVTERTHNVLWLNNRDQFFEYYYKVLQLMYNRFVRDSQMLDGIILLNSENKQIVSYIEELGQVEKWVEKIDPPTVLTEIQTDIINLYDNVFAIVTYMPFEISDNGVPTGVIVGISLADQLFVELNPGENLGVSGVVYLVDTAYSLIDAEEFVSKFQTNCQLGSDIQHSRGIETAITTKSTFSGEYTDICGTQVFGSARWIEELDLVLVVEQNLEEAYSSMVMTLAVNLGIIIAAVVLMMFVSIFVTRSITKPIVDLANTAVEISEGSFESLSGLEDREDEIGVLSRAFDSMTRQLQTLINNLERRVEARTKALQSRATQLEISSRISREITSILNIDELLEHIVKIINESFGFFVVNIFLLDPKKEMLVLRASSAEIDITGINYSLEVKSLNSVALKENRLVVENNTEESFLYFQNALFPLVKSGLVIPLRMGNNVIGTLDVNSATANTFTKEDLVVIQSLGDQIAIAINNARLYERSKQLAVLEERNRLARELHDSVTQSLYSLGLLIEGWRQMRQNDTPMSEEEQLNRMAEINQQSLKEMRLLIHELRPPVLEKEGLLNALQQRLDAVESRTGIKARLISNQLGKLPLSIESCLYRITIEALNNVIRHSEADQVMVSLKMEDQGVILEISDNGKGFEVSDKLKRTGMGLVMMTERADEIDADLEIDTAPGDGTTIRVICFEYHKNR